jgi:hypothetical protein
MVRNQLNDESVKDICVMGVFALELPGGDAPGCAALTQTSAGELVTLLACDLAALVPDARELELSLAAAHFDPAEILRPGWPVHRRLQELAQRAPGREQGPRVIAFGTGADGEIPQPLQADANLRGGALRVLPFLLRGDMPTVAKVSASFEEMLLERGMAQADTALFVQNAFAARIEHARYLTLHDLAAMTALQYQHGGLQALWPLIETALLQTDGETWLDAPPEPLLHYARGEARIAMFTPASWKRRYATQSTDNDERLLRTYEHFQIRQRQFSAVLEAHGIAVLFVYCAEGDDPRSVLVESEEQSMR